MFAVCSPIRIIPPFTTSLLCRWNATLAGVFINKTGVVPRSFLFKVQIAPSHLLFSLSDLHLFIYLVLFLCSPMSFCNKICYQCAFFRLPTFAYYQQFVRNLPQLYKYVSFKFTSVTKSFKVSLSFMFCFSIWCVHHLNKMLFSQKSLEFQNLKTITVGSLTSYGHGQLVLLRFLRIPLFVFFMPASLHTQNAFLMPEPDNCLL